MPRTWFIALGLVLCLRAFGQNTPPAQATSGATPPVPSMARPGSVGIAKPQEAQGGTQPSSPGQPVALTLRQALSRAQQYSLQFLQADYAARLAHEDSIQARAALLPSASLFSQFIYTQPNGTPSGIFVPNDGPHLYSDYAAIHGDIYAPGKVADWRRATAAEAVARAQADIAERGLIAAVTQAYYSLAVAQRKLANSEQALADAEQFLEITSKQEQGGEAAHADVVKAEIQVEQRRTDLENARLDQEKARIALGVMIFPDYDQAYTIDDDLAAAATLPPYSEVQTLASTNNPELRAAQETVKQQNYEIKSARAAVYPTVSFDYFYGISANQVAVRDPERHNLLGSVAQVQMTVPLWTWGATRSKVRQSQLRLEQANTELTLTQRRLLSNLQSFYAEAQVGAAQLAALSRTADLSAESLRLTVLRYQAGEATALEVSDAESTLAQARNTYADGLLRYRLAIANLQTLTGAF